MRLVPAIVVALLAVSAAAPASAAIKIFQTSDPPAELGKIERGSCTERGRGNDKFLKVVARSTNRDFRLEISIVASEWRGFGREYKFRYGAPDNVFYLVGGGKTYSNAYAPPGLEGQDSGGVAFRPNGGKMSAGFLPTPTRNLRSGVVLAGAMRC